MEDKFEEISGRGLAIYTNPAGARVFIDGVERGLTPVTFENLPPGNHLIRLTRDGYRDRIFTVTLFNNSRLEVSIKMEEESGIARITVYKAEGSPGNLPFNPQISIDGLTGNIPPVFTSHGNVKQFNLPVGFRTIRARAFGWEDASVTVRIEDRVTTAAEIYMKPAAFKLDNVSQSRRRFNPNNSGSLGITEYHFEVSAPGNGVLTVLNSGRDVVYEKRFDSFNTWFQSAKWDGRDSSGNPLPEGRYIAVIEASPANGFYADPQDAVAMTLETEINYSINIFPLSLSGGIAGLSFAPLAHTLPAGSFQVEGNIFFGSFHTPEESSGEPYEKAFSGLPFEIGLRIAPFMRLEITSVFNVHPRFDNPTGWGVAGSLKYNILNGGGIPLALAAGVSYAWASENGEAPQSPGRGVGIYAPLSLELAKFSLIFSPAVFWRGPHGPVPALLLSAGVLYRGQWMNAGFSIRPEIDFNASPIADNIRFLTGIDIRFFPPPSNLVFSVQAGMWTHGQQLGGYGGFGIGVIY